LARDRERSRGVADVGGYGVAQSSVGLILANRAVALGKIAARELIELTTEAEGA
jgi:hypothetical protein